MRDARDAWSRLEATEWELLIVGGGIVGAGLFLEASRRGVRTVLVEQRDFAWGSSGRSSKLIHGGLRYLAQGQVHLTRTLLRERDRLMAEAPELVQPLPFLLVVAASRPSDRALFRLAVTLYELLRARRPRWSWYDPDALVRRWPGMDPAAVLGAWRYSDASADDARLVWRLVEGGIRQGGLAVPYAEAEALVLERGRVAGVEIRDVASNRRVAVGARLVVNAAGAWSDTLRRSLALPPRYRPLRGSHLVLDRPATFEAAAFRHPRDGRYLYAVPWEGKTVLGVTDLDHDQDPARDPHATTEEIAYLLEGAEAWQPRAPIAEDDILASFAGVRPVVGRGRSNSYLERRSSVVWVERGLVTATAGKLTSFRVLVGEILKKTGMATRRAQSDRLFEPAEPDSCRDLPPERTLRLYARFGAAASEVQRWATPAELEPVDDTVVLWAEVRRALREELVTHLDDLLLRRTRLGFLVRDGGRSLMPRLRALCEEELGWDAVRWTSELERYDRLWRYAYASEGGGPESALLRKA